MAKQVKTTAPGAGPETKLGPTPAPVRPYKSPNLAQLRVFDPNYGTNSDPSASSVPPGRKNNSPLADELKRVNAKGDGGDHLQDVIEHGTSRNLSVDLQSPQTRTVSSKMLAPGHGMKRQTAQSSKPGDVVVGSLPAMCGASAAPDPKDPYA